MRELLRYGMTVKRIEETEENEENEESEESSGSLWQYIVSQTFLIALAVQQEV